MDTKLTRRESRENAFLAAFSITFGEEDLEQTLADCREDAEHPLDAFGEALIRGFYDHSAEIDEMIAAHLKGWSMSRIPRLNMTAFSSGSATATRAFPAMSWSTLSTTTPITLSLRAE